MALYIALPFPIQSEWLTGYLIGYSLWLLSQLGTSDVHSPRQGDDKGNMKQVGYPDMVIYTEKNY